MLKHQPDKPFETIGQWFLPETPDRVISGSLHYTKEQTELQLQDSLLPFSPITRLEDLEQEYHIIHGTTREGHKITLMNCIRVGSSYHFDSNKPHVSEKINSHWMLIGDHVTPEFNYAAMRFRIPGLQIWLSRPFIKQPTENPNMDEDVIEEYRILKTENEETRIPTIDADLIWDTSIETQPDIFTSLSIKVSGWVVIRPDIPRNIDWFLEQQEKITTFLTFFAGTSMSPNLIQLSLDNFIYNTANLMVALRDSNYCSYKYIHEFFMPRMSMNLDLEQSLVNWFELYPKLMIPSRLTRSIIASNNLPLHMKFLTLMQALEGFHRSLYKGDYMSEKNYDSVKKLLNNAIPPELKAEHKEALRSKIKYGYQYSLGKRLNLLASKLSEPINLLILGHKTKVPRKWVNTRNYLTHWDEELRPDILTNKEMYYATIRMQIFLIVLYLKHIDVEETDIMNALQNNSILSEQLLQINQFSN